MQVYLHVTSANNNLFYLEHKTVRYERFFSIAVNALGAPCVSVIRSREVSVTRRFSMY